MTQNPKIHLRALEPEDLELLYRIENDVELWNVGTSNVPYSRWTLHEYIANSTGDIYTDHQVRLMIENDADAVAWQHGTSYADVMYEAMVEGAITRMMGISFSAVS